MDGCIFLNDRYVEAKVLERKTSLNIIHLNITELLFVKMEKIFILLILINIFVFQASFAAEIDSVTPRKLQLENSLNIINTIFNQRMQEGIQKANAQQGDIEDIAENIKKACNSKKFFL